MNGENVGSYLWSVGLGGMCSWKISSLQAGFVYKGCKTAPALGIDGDRKTIPKFLTELFVFLKSSLFLFLFSVCLFFDWFWFGFGF